MKALDAAALLLVIIGGLNWALVALFEWDLVAWLFGGMEYGIHGGVEFGDTAAGSRIVYALVGAAALYCIPRFLMLLGYGRGNTR
jgi:uncharacterized protein